MTTTTKTQIVLVYDTPGSGDAYLADVHGEFGDRTLGEFRAQLGQHSTLPGAVGEARKQGYKVDGWTRTDSGLAWIFPVNQICTPFDNVPQTTCHCHPGRPLQGCPNPRCQK